jgi:hypothetical protein
VDVNIIDNDTKAIEINIDTLLSASKGIGLAVNIRKLNTWKQKIIRAG